MGEPKQQSPTTYARSRVDCMTLENARHLKLMPQKVTNPNVACIFTALVCALVCAIENSAFICMQLVQSWHSVIVSATIKLFAFVRWSLPNTPLHPTAANGCSIFVVVIVVIDIIIVIILWGCVHLQQKVSWNEHGWCMGAKLVIWIRCIVCIGLGIWPWKQTNRKRSSANVSDGVS